MRYSLLTFVITLSFSATALADTIKVSVNGMVCAFCATGIEKTFKAQSEVKTINVDLEKKLVTIETKQDQTIDDAKVKRLIANAGYSLVGITRAK
jgi:cation transport ATPase